MQIEKKGWFCPLPYLHLEIQPTGDVFVCCHSLDPKKIENLHNKNLRSIWESIERKKYEEAFNNKEGEFLKHCLSCKKLELEKGVSGRQKEEVRWDSHSPMLVTKGPKSLAIRFSNLCNLKCRTCKPSTSTAWFNDAKKINLKVKLQKLHATPKAEPLSEQIEWFLKNGLQEIYFAGGEALLEPDHYATLKKIISINPHLKITYDTNFSVLGLGGLDVLDLWKSLTNLTVSASIDGAHDKCEYLRSGLNWEDFKQNWNRVKAEAPHINIKIHFTVSIYNIFHFPDFIKTLTRDGYISETKNLDIGLCEDPIWLNIRALPIEIKREVLEVYEHFKETELGIIHKECLDEIISYLKIDYDIKYFIAFAAFTKKIDIIRGEQFSDTFPLAFEHFKQYVKL